MKSVPGFTDLIDAVRPIDLADSDAAFARVISRQATVAVSRGELWQKSLEYGIYLRGHAVASGDVVIIIMDHGWQMLAAFLGAMQLGAIPTFMPPLSGKQDPARYWSSHRELFKRLTPGAILLDDKYIGGLRENLPDLSVPVLPAGAAGTCVQNSAFGATIDPENTAFLQHSSGTTGLKKGVALTHRAVLAQLRSYMERLEIRPEDCIVSWLPFYHDMGLVACFLLPLVARIPLVLLDPFEWVANPAQLFAAISHHRATLCWQPNFAFQHLCRSIPSATAGSLSTVRAWINCSEPCRPETFERFAEQFAAAGVRREHLQVCYAMAETVFAVTQTSLGQPVRTMSVKRKNLQERQEVALAHEGETASRILSTGRPIEGAKVEIVDREGCVLSDGCIGTVAISGNFMFSRYFRLEEESLRRIRDGKYYTTDLGFIYDGELYITGRSSDLIIVHGKNYYAHELEAVVGEVAGVRPGRCVAVGCFRAESGSEELVILLEAAVLENGTASAGVVGRVRRAIRDEAGLLAWDVRVVPYGWLVKTTSGKFSRSDNLAKYLQTKACLETPLLT